MICAACHNPITFYAHQHWVPAPVRYFHPECCPNCPERHRAKVAV